MTDRNFDDLAERFERKLYGNLRGQIRLQLVTEALLTDCSGISGSAPLHVLDAGCGLGQITTLLADRGHRVVACDLSSVLLERMRATIAANNPAHLGHIDFVCGPLQNLDRDTYAGFDLIVFHAVLEWLEDPRAGLANLVGRLRPGGELSLLFYNRHSIVFKNLLRGDFRRLDEQDYRGDPGGLTPTHPLVPDEVATWLEALGMEVVSKRGIRTFYDYMEQSMDRNKPALGAPADILRMERRLSTEEPYRSLGRYQLWHCRRISPTPSDGGYADE